MSEECSLCVETPVAGAYTIDLESKEITDVPLCEDCLVGLRETDWIEIEGSTPSVDG